MLNSCHVVPTQVLSHALFSLPSHKPQHQRSAISIPSPIPLHLPFPFLVSSANEREPQMLVSSLFLKNFPRLCHTPPPKMPTEMGRTRRHRQGKHLRKPSPYPLW